MELAEKMALLDAGLVRVVEQLGDITAPAMERFYHRYPDARASFERLSNGDMAQLEGSMVETALYCLMYWFDRPSEIEILFNQSVPHHHDTLDVMSAWYSGLIDTVVDVIVATIPPENDAEKAIWDELRAGLNAAIARCLSYSPMQREPT